MPLKYYCVLDGARPAAILSGHARGVRKSAILIAPILNPIFTSRTMLGKMAAGAEQRPYKERYYIEHSRLIQNARGRAAGKTVCRVLWVTFTATTVSVAKSRLAVESACMGARLLCRPTGQACEPLKWSLSCWSWSWPAARGCPACIRSATE